MAQPAWEHMLPHERAVFNPYHIKYNARVKCKSRLRQNYNEFGLFHLFWKGKLVDSIKNSDQSDCMYLRPHLTSGQHSMERAGHFSTQLHARQGSFMSNGTWRSNGGITNYDGVVILPTWTGAGEYLSGSEYLQLIQTTLEELLRARPQTRIKNKILQ